MRWRPKGSRPWPIFSAAIMNLLTLSIHFFHHRVRDSLTDRTSVFCIKKTGKRTNCPLAGLFDNHCQGRDTPNINDLLLKWQGTFQITLYVQHSQCQLWYRHKRQHKTGRYYSALIELSPELRYHSGDNIRGGVICCAAIWLYKAKKQFMGQRNFGICSPDPRIQRPPANVPPPARNGIG